MKIYEAQAVIDATAEEVWDVMTDGARFTEWDSGIVGFEGSIEPGQKVKLRSEVDPGRTFAIDVTSLDKPHRMVWASGMPLGLFRGERTYRLEPESGGVRFTMREEFSGPLLGLIWRTMPDLQPSFDKFATGLKACVEAERQGGAT